MADPHSIDQDSICFVIMPFGSWFDTYYTELYVPAITEAGLEPHRADDLSRPGNFFDDIWRYTIDAKVILADLSTMNPNVFYELGLAHALSRPTVLISESVKEIPADLRSLRIIEYDKNDPDWGEKLKNKIGDALHETIKHPVSRVLQAQLGDAGPQPGEPDTGGHVTHSLVEDDFIRLGQTGPFRGAASEIGKALRAGAEAYFTRMKPLTDGKKIKLLSENDYYEPATALENVYSLRRHVFCFFGCVGTPTSELIGPKITSQRIPYFAPFTGARFLRDKSGPHDGQYTINVRASYDAEVDSLLECIRAHKRKKIAVFYQNDAYGLGVQQHVEANLNKGESVVGFGKYERNTTEIAAALKAIIEAQPDAVVLAGVYSTCATFITNAKDSGLQNCLFLCLSFVGSVPLKKRLGKQYESNVVISQVVPYPWANNIPIIQEYQNAMGDEELSFASLEGYINAKTFAAIARNSDGPLTPDSFIESARRIKELDLGGFRVTYDGSEDEGHNKVYLVKIEDGKFSSITTSEVVAEINTPPRRSTKKKSKSTGKKSKSAGKRKAAS